MNRYLYLIIMWLCSLSVFAQTDGYDPENPPLPDFPNEEEQDTTRYYNLVVNSSPAQSGSLNTSGGQYPEKASVYLYTYNNGNLYFMYWIDDEGNTLATSNSFYYTMPKRDAVVTAVYKYNPSNPGIPDIPEDETKVPRYSLTLSTKPAGAGSFNTSSTTLKENESIHLYAYTNSNFYFQHWEDAEGNVISTAQNFYYAMPAKDTQLYGVYKYNPSNPGNPGKNSYDSFTGEVIVDDFTPGNLSSAIYEVTNGNTSNITKITVAGKVNSYDFSIANNYSTCTIVDLSRTTGATNIPSYCYDGNTYLNKLYLPASITNIEYSAFRDATSLTELTCYASVPPTLDSQVFAGVTEGLTVYVPASSLELYENATVWKDYVDNGTIIIMPIRNQVASVEINLPAECADGRYKNMPLELMNIKSGQRYKYVVTDRINYIFNNLIRNTRYVATLKNLSGAVLAKSDTLNVEDENISYDFQLKKMKQLRTVKASVVSAAGDDVTAQCSLNWYDAAGTFLAQGTSLGGQVSETKVKCSVSLSQALAMENKLPTDTLYEVIEDDNSLVYTLTALPKMVVKGKVLDKMTKQVLSGASVTISQTLNGKYSKSFTTKTDSKGEYTMQVFAAPSSLTYAASDYISQTVELSDSVLSLAEATLATVELKSITGATITTNFTYTKSVAATVEPEVQNYYSDYNNVAYSIQNETAGKAITQFNVQYPSIVLLEEVNEGDSLTIVAKSKNSAFMDITTGGRIDDSNRMSVTIPVVQFGGINATFTTTENSKVLGILYDSKGTFVNKYSYGSSTLSVTELKDGEYTLVTMGESDFFGSIYNIDKFTEAGLQQNIDYLVNKVTVKSGIISPLKNVLVPFFDESKFYYTGDNTSFSVNKTSIVAGNYLTLTAKVDFKEAYKSSVSDVNIVVELPEGTTFVDNSVMVGSATAYYEMNGNTLTIPLDNNVSADRVRFCIIPTLSGSYSPNAAVEFKLGEKSVRQPIGSTSYTVQDVAISVPSEIHTPEITISGIAYGRADVVVYANGEVLGTTRALANGYWYLTTELENPYNLEEFSIYANVSTSTGLSVNTETKSCRYNKDVIVAKTVDMSFYNGWMNKNITVTFDLEHQTSDATSYSFYTTTDFTFAANLSNNDTTIVKGVTIGVYTDHEGWMNLEATYNAKMDRWVAVHKFGSGNLPTGVKVDINSISKFQIDSNVITTAFGNHVYIAQQMEECKKELEGVLTLLSEYLNRENEALSIEEITEIASALDIDYHPTVIESLSEEAINKDLQNCETLLNTNMITSLDGLINACKSDLSFLPEYLKGVSVLNCSDLSEEVLAERGFIGMDKTDGSKLYVLAVDGSYELVDLTANMHIVFSENSMFARALANEDNSSISSVQNWINTIDNLCNNLQSATNAVFGAIESIEGSLNAANKQLTSQIGNMMDDAIYLQRKGGNKFLLSLLDEKIHLAILAKQANNKILSWIATNVKNFRPSAAGKAFGVVGLLFTARDAVKDLGQVVSLHSSCMPCPDDEDNAKTIQRGLVGLGVGAGIFYAGQLTLSIASVFGMESGIFAAIPTGGASLAAVGISIGIVAGNFLASVAYTRGFENGISGFKTRISNLKCYKCPVCHQKPCQCCKKCGHYPCTCKPQPEIPPILDPSGYVYEGVSSNRLQGVTATCYYKETVEDMYGDLHENIVLWDAEEYAQKNPLFTDENGMYAWDVPQGLWQVKFDKEGYVSTQSEWLPVPPPQMDVNIGMVQNSQPEVVGVRAYEDGVEVEFSKYMNIETLNKENIFVKVVKDKEESLISDAEIELLNKEVTIAGKETEYASKVKVATDQLGYYDEAYLIVSTGVTSYAGVPMAQTFEQKLDVEKKVRELLVETEFNVEYNGQTEVMIAATPADAAVGKKLSVQTASEMIATTDVKEVTFDADGQAKFTVSGELYGTTALNYSLLDADLTATSLVNVVDPVRLEPVKAPMASRISGTAVYRGQTVALSCESEGATIYYTTDGSCPCDEAKRIKYERPIAINDAMTIKFMAIGANFDESEVKECSYSIRQSDVKLSLAKGWNWSSHDVASPVSVDEFAGVASRIMTQTEDAVEDPVLGLVGTLTSINSGETMKIEAKDASVMEFTGELYNPVLSPIVLHEGWNWLGYPINQTMTVGDALSYLDTEEGDCISNLEKGFATFTNGNWEGTLETLTPGSGYLYKSASNKSFIYNNVPTVANAKAIYGHRLATSVSPWAVDKHRYPNMMSVIGKVCYADGMASDSTYYIGAFVGEECRGVGKYDNGIMYMSIYGERVATVSFKAWNICSETLTNLTETIPFNADVIGTSHEPFMFKLGYQPTGIDNIGNSYGVDGIYNLQGIKMNSITNRGIYIIKSTDANGNSTMKKQYVK